MGGQIQSKFFFNTVNVLICGHMNKTIFITNVPYHNMYHTRTYQYDYMAYPINDTLQDDYHRNNVLI